ncbi:MAG: hypothetical protein IKX30_17360 [Victivallales bacterium]|nr:hypothetical protein [Victivallales bacterium]
MKEAIEQYISKTLGQRAELHKMPVHNEMPMFYTSLYDFYSSSLSNEDCVFCIDKGVGHASPLKLQKQHDFLHGFFHKHVIYCVKSLEFHAAERMMARGIPFIVPGKGLSLPFLAVILKTTIRRRPLAGERFSTFAQLVVQGVLLHKLSLPLSINETEKILGCSHASAVNALLELEQLGFGEKEKTLHGRSVVFQFKQQGKELWEASQNYLVNPCKRQVGIVKRPDDIPLFKAGANALAEHTMLSEALPEIYAASLTDFRKGNYEIVLADEADIVLQLWRYRPNILGENKIDPLSLVISLRDDNDERVQMAIDELLEGFQW